MSSDLVWLITRESSSFLVKRPNSIQFSREQGNLMNKNSLKFSTLTQKPVSIKRVSGGAEVTLKKHKASPNSVAKATKITIINKDCRRGAAAAKNVVAHYRADLKNAAAARVSRILQTQRAVAKADKPKRFRGRARK